MDFWERCTRAFMTICKLLEIDAGRDPAWDAA
jgi:hypothetical protein